MIEWLATGGMFLITMFCLYLADRERGRHG